MRGSVDIAEGAQALALGFVELEILVALDQALEDGAALGVDFEKPPAERFADLGVLLGEIGGFVGIRVEAVKLPRFGHHLAAGTGLGAREIQDELPRTVGEGEGALPRRRVMFFAGLRQSALQAFSRSRRSGRPGLGELEEERWQIGEGEGRRDARAAELAAGQLDEQGHPQDLAVERQVETLAVLPESLAMIRRDDDEAVVPEIEAAQVFDEPSELVVDVGDAAVVEADHPGGDLRRPAVALAQGSGQGADEAPRLVFMAAIGVGGGSGAEALVEGRRCFVGEAMVLQVDVEGVEEKEKTLLAAALERAPAKPADDRVDLVRGIADRAAAVLEIDVVEHPQGDAAQRRGRIGIVAVGREALVEISPAADEGIHRPADEAGGVVAALAEGLGEGDEARIEAVLEVEEPEGGGVEPGEEGAVGCEGPVGVGPGFLEDHRLVGEGVEIRARVAVVAVETEVVGAQGVDRDQDHVRRQAQPGREVCRIGRRTAGGDEQTYDGNPANDEPRGAAWSRRAGQTFGETSAVRGAENEGEDRHRCHARREESHGGVGVAPGGETVGDVLPQEGEDRYDDHRGKHGGGVKTGEREIPEAPGGETFYKRGRRADDESEDDGEKRRQESIARGDDGEGRESLSELAGGGGGAERKDGVDRAEGQPDSRPSPRGAEPFSFHLVHSPSYRAVLYAVRLRYSRGTSRSATNPRKESPEVSTTSPEAHHTIEEIPKDHPSLTDRIPDGGTKDPDEILDLFIGWTTDCGLELYPAQEEALLELMAGRHVILNTPTGSGKSLVALGLHFKGLCEGHKSFYTSPIKALASEKFFALCDELGPENVGMQTGDASINPDAPVICCTAEVLANRALRQGTGLDAEYVVMDEFHYYGDPERGWAWQVPLITLPYTRFLLMSATLGNTAPISERIERDTSIKVSLVSSNERPVPLDFDYRDTPLHESVEELFESRRAPIYIVNFTQRECAELAQSLTSLKLIDKSEKKEIRKTISGFRFDTPYGKDIRRFLGFGVGIHHAGLLPKYRLLVEQLAQQGLLKVICGTDTLGVGVNIPIRTVLFTKLSKYDGQKTSILKVRDFKQIAGRAGRKGFDDRGSVVVQAPEHVIENRRRTADVKKGKKNKKRPPKKPPRGFVSWNKDTFDKLISQPPEMLKSRFRVTPGMLVNLLQRDAERDDPNRDNFDSLRELIKKSHEDERTQAKILSYSAVLARSLQRAGVIKLEKDSDTEYRWVVVNEDLQWDFSLFQALALYLVEAIENLDPEDREYGLDVASLVEAILESPKAVIYRQLDKIKGDLIGRWKADGIPYEERMERLEGVTHEKPLEQFIYEQFELFRRDHPWVRGEDIQPKSIAREMFDDYHSFTGYVREYGMARSEGVLLRYLSQFYKTMAQTVPERAKTESVYDILGFFRAMLERTDTSLLEEWESLIHPELALEEDKREEARQQMRIYELFHDPKAFAARVRAELHQLVRDLAEHDYEGAAFSVWQDPDNPEENWSPDDFQEAMASFYDEHERIVFNHDARRADRTNIRSVGTKLWEVAQVLVDPEGENLWHIEGEIDLSDGTVPEGPLIRLRRIGT